MYLKLRRDVSETASRCIWNCVAMYLMLRRDVSDAASGRIWYYVGTYLMLCRDVISSASMAKLRKKIEIPKYWTQKMLFCSILSVFFLKKIRWNLLNSLKWANYESFTSIGIMIWQQSQFLQYAYVCCQTTLLCCKERITTRNNNRYIGIIYIK